MELNAEFQWKQEPAAERFVERYLTSIVSRIPDLADFEEQLVEQTSSRLFDWVDHLSLPMNEELHFELELIGFTVDSVSKTETLYRHKRAQLPAIALNTGKRSGCYIKVDEISAFLMVHGLKRKIEGALFSPYRRALVTEVSHCQFWVVERRGTRTLEPTHPGSSYLTKYMKAKEYWRTRPRTGEDEEGEIHQAIQLAKELTAELGQDVAASLVLEVEREFWQAKNRAGQIQKARQDHLGLGWANHDHHTFRSSRETFTLLVELFQVLGFHCRERFYAGEEAGWGAQVMENETASLVLFLDVDLSPEELMIDFSKEPLPGEKELGTIGLWCALHGDSITSAGMHHLEAQFTFDQLKEDLEKRGVQMMDPFSDFSYLKQAFTEAERWWPSEARIERLLDENLISEEQSQVFLTEGAVGSHLENLQRREGYKGFNQENVSKIIRRTDPRN